MILPVPVPTFLPVPTAIFSVALSALLAIEMNWTYTKPSNNLLTDLIDINYRLNRLARQILQHTGELRDMRLPAA